MFQNLIENRLSTDTTQNIKYFFKKCSITLYFPVSTSFLFLECRRVKKFQRIAYSIVIYLKGASGVTILVK